MVPIPGQLFLDLTLNSSLASSLTLCKPGCTIELLTVPSGNLGQFLNLGPAHLSALCLMNSRKALVKWPSGSKPCVRTEETCAPETHRTIAGCRCSRTALTSTCNRSKRNWRDGELCWSGSESKRALGSHPQGSVNGEAEWGGQNQHSGSAEWLTTSYDPKGASATCRWQGGYAFGGRESSKPKF
jgi:hypothetical protein